MTLPLFEQQFHRFLETPELLNQNDGAFYNLGITLVVETPDLDVKERILTHLLTLFPERYELYYYMGYIFKTTDVMKTLMWFQICHRLNPSYMENNLDLGKILFDFNYLSYTHRVAEAGQMATSNDPRALLLWGSLLAKERRFKAAKAILETLVQRIEQGQVQDAYVMDAVATNLYFIEGKRSTPSHPSLGMQGRAPTMTQCMNDLILYDYVYHNVQERFQKAQAMRVFYEKVPPLRPFPPPPSKHTPPQIHVGYLCGLFTTNHATSRFLLPILEHHSRDQFKITVFTDRLIQLPDIHTVCLSLKSDQECAYMIRECGIDILIDIDGYTNGNRLGILAYRPAPVQITYLGYPNSTGLEFIQYRITDRVADPVEGKQPFSEKRLYMPRSFLLFGGVGAGACGRGRGARRDTLVLGALNKELKNSPEVLQAWHRILHETAASETKILIKIDGSDTLEERRRHYLTALGLEDTPKRLEVVGFCSDDEYDGLFRQTDVLLDTFPYSGTTTTCNALQHSVPVVTMTHPDYHAHNVSASLLVHCGHLDALITTSVDAYVAKVVALCHDRDQIHHYHATIRSRFAALMEPTRFMQEYEALLKSTLPPSPPHLIQEN